MSMAGKGIWFVAGAAAGVYATVRARRAAEVFTYDGFHDRLSGIFAGARVFADQVREGAAEKEAELRERLDPDHQQVKPQLNEGTD